ncbi:hypothetical protein L9G74_04560 [Shewanella sp. C32]|uniref:Uncharacterized protein n=1 Tax=Shewanella electrica TaxID=515560 RepID=A0ABT2FH90_9GAMM|nr:hypothetical protein [Shewanella electrica]MCH1923604.1 hypothetical protein [Shewanella electrica]MCS4555700.1 hypothetical protein [Shewanella electrica]
MASKKSKFAIFRPGTHIVAKVFACIFMVILFASLISIFVNVLIDTWLVEALYWVAGGLSLIMILVVTIALCISRDYRERSRLQVGSPWKMVLGMLVGIPLLMVMGICKGLPSVLHMMLPSEERVVIVTVDHKPSSYYNRGCDGELFINEFDGLFSNVCGIQKADWQQLQAEQKIMLFGKRSAIGFSYKGYRLGPVPSP